MEPKNLDARITDANILKQVTPLSKYLAMAIFIIMPFLGGYVGYHYASESAVGHAVVTEEIFGVHDIDTQVLFQKQYNTQQEILFLYKTKINDNKYYLTTNHSSKPSILFRYDTNSQRFYETGITIDWVLGEKASPNGRYVLKVDWLNDESGVTANNFSIFDLETESVVKEVQLPEGETLLSSVCGYAGFSFDINWESDSTVLYGVYYLNSVNSAFNATETGSDCDIDFIEYRKASVTSSFSSLKDIEYKDISRKGPTVLSRWWHEVHTVAFAQMLILHAV